MRWAAAVLVMLLAGCVAPGGATGPAEEEAASGYVFDDGPPPDTEAEGEGAAVDPEPEPVLELKPEESVEEEPVETGPTRVDLNAPARERCTRRGGTFTRTPAGLFVCVQPTRDANRACDGPGQCEAGCLARSRTCAPVTPLLGCYEQITARGVATVCVD